jgi:hypothetical protein
LKEAALFAAGAGEADADVKLTVGNRTVEVKSSDYGVFKIGALHSPYNSELSLAGAKAGYLSFEKWFHANERLQSIVITLSAASKYLRGSRRPPQFVNELLLASAQPFARPANCLRWNSAPT